MLALSGISTAVCVSLISTREREVPEPYESLTHREHMIRAMLITVLLGMKSLLLPWFMRCKDQASAMRLTSKRNDHPVAGEVDG